MKKILFFTAVVTVFMGIVNSATAQKISAQSEETNILYFNPEVEPDIEEIKEPTNNAFFTTVSDKMSTVRKNRMMRSETNIPYENIDPQTISEYCKNNDADFAIVPKVKYFKVGLGKYVFSNQVIVSMKLFDAQGNFIVSSDYDTYRKNMRLLGSAENSIKIGTNGALKSILKQLKKIRKSSDTEF